MQKYKRYIILICCMMLIAISFSVLMESSIAGVVGKYFKEFTFPNAITIKRDTYTITFIDQYQPIKVQYTHDNGTTEIWDGQVTMNVGTTISLDPTRLTLVNNTGKVLQGWENAGGTIMSEIPASHNTDIVLYPVWANEYWIRFMDGLGNGVDNVLYSAAFTKGKKPNLDQTEIDKALETAQDRYDVQYGQGAYVITGWDINYNGNIYNVENDIVVTAVGAPAAYNGTLTFTPIDDTGDGVPDRYKTSGVDKSGTVLVEIPQYYNGKLVTDIGANTFAEFANIHVVTFSGDIDYIGDNAFADNDYNNTYLGVGKTNRETVTIYYEGDDYASFTQKLQNHFNNNDFSMFSQNWDDGMGAGSRIFFLTADANGELKVNKNAGYWELTRKTGFPDTYSWKYVSTVDMDFSSDECDCGDAHTATGGKRPDYIYWPAQ